MLITTLKLAQRMLEIGESEQEVASALLNHLHWQYPTALDLITPRRVVCQNTIQHDPVMEVAGEPWHGLELPQPE